MGYRKKRSKGLWKMKKTCFKKGHIPHNKGKKSTKNIAKSDVEVDYVRAREDIHKLVVNDPNLQRQSTSDQTEKTIMLLRPHPAKLLEVEKKAGKGNPSR